MTYRWKHRLAFGYLGEEAVQKGENKGIHWRRRGDNATKKQEVLEKKNKREKE